LRHYLEIITISIQKNKANIKIIKLTNLIEKKTEENKEEISFAFLFLFENKYSREKIVGKKILRRNEKKKSPKTSSRNL
jgi:hypothetical protein